MTLRSFPTISTCIRILEILRRVVEHESEPLKKNFVSVELVWELKRYTGVLVLRLMMF